MVLVATLLTPAAYGATKSPTPVPKATASKKATPVKKPVVKKKVIVTKKPVAKKKKSVSPSPSPKWPPAGFKSNGEVFAKIPTAKELVSTASSNVSLTRQLAQLVNGVRICEKFTCGAVQLASTNGCTWWEISANVVGQTSADDKTIRNFGLIQMLGARTAPKQITTILLISQEPLELHHSVSGVSANCHHDTTTLKLPSSTYTVVNN